MAALKELREKQATLVAQARAKLDEIADDTEESRAKEIEAEYDRIMADYDRFEERVSREEALAERQARLDEPDPRRPVGEDTVVKPEAEQEASPQERHAAAFRNYLRYGSEGLAPEQRAILVRMREPQETRAQGVAVGSEGGYLVPEGFQAELMVSLKAYGPMNDMGIVRQLTTATGNSIPWPTMDDTSNTGALIAENTQVALAEIAFGTKQLDAYKYTSGVVLVASELLQDSALDVEAIVRSAMAERIGRIANTHLTTGDGTGKPNGIVTASAQGFTAASGTAITFDDMIELEHSVDPAYRGDPSVRWMFHDTTLKALRKIKDAEGNYIWQPADVRTGAPPTILTYPFSVNQAMAAIGLSAKSVLFGACNRYVARLVKQFAIRRLVERYADYDQTGFIGFTRLDGELLDAGALKHLLHPAA